MHHTPSGGVSTRIGGEPRGPPRRRVSSAIKMATTTGGVSAGDTDDEDEALGFNLGNAQSGVHNNNKGETSFGASGSSAGGGARGGKKMDGNALLTKILTYLAIGVVILCFICMLLKGCGSANREALSKMISSGTGGGSLASTKGGPDGGDSLSPPAGLGGKSKSGGGGGTGNAASIKTLTNGGSKGSTSTDGGALTVKKHPHDPQEKVSRARQAELHGRFGQNAPTLAERSVAGKKEDGNTSSSSSKGGSTNGESGIIVNREKGTAQAQKTTPASILKLSGRAAPGSRKGSAEKVIQKEDEHHSTEGARSSLTSNKTVLKGSTEDGSKGGRKLSGSVKEGDKKAEGQSQTNKTPVPVAPEPYTEGPWHILHELPHLFGIVYITAWSLCYYPQMIINYQHKSIIGVSPGLILYNTIGFMCYTAYNLVKTYVQNTYHTAPAVTMHDVVFALHANFCGLVILMQAYWYCPEIFRRENIGTPRGIFMHDFIVIVTIIAVMAIALLAAWMGQIEWFSLPHSKVHLTQEERALDPSHVVSFLSVLAFVKVLVTVLKYPSQIILNFKRKSTKGLSVYTYLLDFTGGVFSVAQNLSLVIIHNNIEYLYGNLPKFFLGGIALVYDMIIFMQFAFFGGEDHLLQEADGAGAEGGGEHGTSALGLEKRSAATSSGGPFSRSPSQAKFSVGNMLEFGFELDDDGGYGRRGEKAALSQGPGKEMTGFADFSSHDFSSSNHGDRSNARGGPAHGGSAGVGVTFATSDDFMPGPETIGGSSNTDFLGFPNTSTVAGGLWAGRSQTPFSSDDDPFSYERKGPTRRTSKGQEGGGNTSSGFEGANTGSVQNAALPSGAANADFGMAEDDDLL